MRFAFKLSILFVCCLIVPGFFNACLKPPESISSRYEILPEKPDGYAISKRVLLVADNQLNHLYGDPVWLRNELFDKFVPVAIRPVQQDLFGQDILKWALTHYGKHYPVVHLGDGTNMACLGEFKAFMEIMDAAQKPWIMAPGNHDAYLLGNMHALDVGWKSACARARGPTTKDLFVEAYLKHLKKQHPDFGAYLDQHPAQGEWRSSGGKDTFLRAVAWTVDKAHPYRSYVVQELDLGRSDSNQAISAIVMDSCQYDKAPTLAPLKPISYNAGISGSMRQDQIAMAEKWLAQGPRNEKLTVLMVHHPYAALIKQAKSAVDGFRKHFNVPLYISGHTHHGEFFVRGGDDGWLELNVGSIVDWPIEFRTFEIHGVEKEPGKLVFRTPLFRVPETWKRLRKQARPRSDPDWEIKDTRAKDFYLAHNYKSSADPKKTQKDILVALLYTYEHFISEIKSAADNKVWPGGCSSDKDVLALIKKNIRKKDIREMTDVLIALGAFDKSRKPENEVMRRDYRLYQAVWASKYDDLKGRKPIVNDPCIRFLKGGFNEQADDNL